MRKLLFAALSVLSLAVGLGVASAAPVQHQTSTVIQGDLLQGGGG